MRIRSSITTLALVMLSYVSVFAQQKPQPSPGAGFGGILPMMILMFGIIYFLMIRPEQKKQKQRQEMLKNVKKGDKILTASGIIGTVGNIKEGTVMVKIADNTVVEFTKSAITTVIIDEKTVGDEEKEKKK